MKLYKFYYKANKNDIAHNIRDDCKSFDSDEYIKDKYPLYAFTNNKKIYKKFKYQRNMNNFIIIKSKLDPDEYVEYAESHRDARLDEYDLNMKDNDGNVHEVTFAITEYEQNVIDDVDIEYLLGDGSLFTPINAFNDEIINALTTLEYPFFYATMTGDYDDEEYGNYNVSAKNNDFAILYSQFSGTFI